MEATLKGEKTYSEILSPWAYSSKNGLVWKYVFAQNDRWFVPREIWIVNLTKQRVNLVRRVEHD